MAVVPWGSPLKNARVHPLSASLVAIGICTTYLGTNQSIVEAIGITLMLIGLGWGYRAYSRSQKQGNAAPESVISRLWANLFAYVLIISSLTFVVAGQIAFSARHSSDKSRTIVSHEGYVQARASQLSCSPDGDRCTISYAFTVPGSSKEYSTTDSNAADDLSDSDYYRLKKAPGSLRIIYDTQNPSLNMDPFALHTTVNYTGLVIGVLIAWFCLAGVPIIIVWRIAKASSQPMPNEQVPNPQNGSLSD